MLELADGEIRWLISYVGRHESLGEAVWVCTQSQRLGTPVDSEVLHGDGYYVFYAATAAARAKLIRKVGFYPEAKRAMPRLLRFIGSLNVDSPRAWRIAESVSIGAPFERRERLTEAEALIPRATIWNHARLLEQLRAGWHPRQDASDAV